MATETLPAGATFVVNSPTSLTYNGMRYEGVTSITLGDGTTRTLQEMYDEASANPVDVSQLKACVKVEGVDPDQNNRQLFTVYSNNSRQVGKNESASVPGGLWCEMFGLDGTPASSYIVKMWDDYYNSLTPPLSYLAHSDQNWLGFRLNYGISEDRVYTMTWVNDMLEESTPCPPTEVGVTHMHFPILSGRFQAPGQITTSDGWPHQFVPIRYFRLYRSNTTEAGTAIYQRVPIEPTSPQAPAAGFPYPAVNALSPAIWDFTFRDTARTDQLLEPLASTDWSQAPYREMAGLTAWRNGMMAAFWKNTVMVCEPFRPFAWPRKYWFPIPEEVIALAIDDNALVAITKGSPYLFTGSHPANVNYEALETAPPGLPAALYNGNLTPSRAVTSTPAGVVYGTPDGLWSVSGGRARALARGLFTDEEWRQRYGNNFPWMRLAYSNGELLCYFQGTTPENKGFKLNVADATPQLCKYIAEYTAGVPRHPAGHFHSPYTGKLHLILPGSPSIIKEAFNEFTARVAASYWTREILLAKPENLGAWLIRGYGGDVTIEVFDDRNRAAIYTKTVSLTGKSVQGRLPTGYKAHNYSVRLTLGVNAIVRELYLASTLKELEGV